MQKLAAIKICGIMHGKNSGKAEKAVPFSNNTMMH
jgi:hypothetical protein